MSVFFSSSKTPNSTWVWFLMSNGINLWGPPMFFRFYPPPYFNKIDRLWHSLRRNYSIYKFGTLHWNKNDKTIFNFCPKRNEGQPGPGQKIRGRGLRHNYPLAIKIEVVTVRVVTRSITCLSVLWKSNNSKHSIYIHNYVRCAQSPQQVA